MRIPVSVACSQSGKAVWLKLEVDEGATALDVAQRANIPKALPGFSLEGRSFGIYGKLVTPETPLKSGDRLEIYQTAVGME